MTPEEIEKLEKWTMVMNLMGFDHESLNPDYEEYDNDDEKNLYETVDMVLTVHRRMATPDKWMAAALRTIDMDVTPNEIYQYQEHLDRLEEERIKQEQDIAEANNAQIILLTNELKFALVEHKRYKHHTNWQFVMPTGIVVTGRLFKPSWGRYRVWLSWKGANGKSQRHKWDCGNGDFTIPASFPKNWREWYGYTTDSVKQAKLISWLMGTKNQKKTGFPPIK